MTGFDQPVHGGDLCGIARDLGCEVSELLDFSANVNALGPPSTLLDELARGAADRPALQRYPEPDGATLRTALGVARGVEPEAVVIANGAAALLETAIATLGVRRCVVPVPAFSEDARALAARGAHLCPLVLDGARGFVLEPEALVRAVRAYAADAVLLTNPHNPTGRLANRETMRAAIAGARTAGARAIVDEAFVDYAAAASVTRDAARADGTIVVRSLTKFYAVPALRVGYAVAEPALARRMRALLPSWPVGTLEMRALAAALRDDAYRDRTLEAAAHDRAALARELERRGFAITPSAANFLLVRLRETDPHATVFRARLARSAHVVVRDCSSYAGLGDGRHVRIAVRGEADRARLLAGLDELAEAAVPATERPGAGAPKSAR